jgi:hypothetical protein
MSRVGQNFTLDPVHGRHIRSQVKVGRPHFHGLGKQRLDIFFFFAFTKGKVHAYSHHTTSMPL